MVLSFSFVFIHLGLLIYLVRVVPFFKRRARMKKCHYWKTGFTLHGKVGKREITCGGLPVKQP